MPPASEHRIEVIGHGSATASLLSAVRTDRLPHTVLLTGAPAIGKRTVARLVIQGLLCSPRSDDVQRPCGACRACRLVTTGGHADMRVLEPPLRIDDARRMQQWLALAPTEAPVRVVLIPEIERASIGAANSLLKTLEEPPAHARLLLTAAAEEGVLPTIRSRARRIHLRAARTDEVARALEQHMEVPSHTATLLARLSGGRMGRAVRWSQDEESLAQRSAWLDELGAALSAEASERIEIAGRLLDEPLDVLRAWSGWWRDILWVQHGLEGSIINLDREGQLTRWASILTRRDAVTALRDVEEAMRRIEANANTQLAMEVLVLALPAEDAPRDASRRDRTGRAGAVPA